MTHISVGGTVMGGKYPIVALVGFLLVTAGIHSKMVLIVLNYGKQLNMT